MFKNSLDRSLSPPSHSYYCVCVRVCV